MRRLSLWKSMCLVCVFCAATPVGSAAQKFGVVATFDNTNGASPGFMTLVQGTDGSFYGTTRYGGTYGYFYGTVFKVTPAGALIVLRNFDGADGQSPASGLVLGTDGNFYGTTEYGGTSTACGSGGCGTVFKITSSGKLSTLHSFHLSDGAYPVGALVQATNGNFYGTTSVGGPNGYGTVFEITPAGKLTVLHSFDESDGNSPEGTLVQGPNGNLYGTTFNYGANDGGTVFEITAAGKLTTLYDFCSQSNCKDGGNPVAWLVLAANGNFYGTTVYGGAHYDNGTVFEITAAGKLTTLYSFCAVGANCTDGEHPYAGLVQATDGNFYGTTQSGGVAKYGGYPGTVFKVTPRGTLTTLHTFCSEPGCDDGAHPYGDLLQATNGILYGTTSGAGADGYGTVFSLSVGLGPFVKTLQTSGAVGTTVIILGNNLTGTTHVTFNGRAASFKVVSSTEITTTVPNGATTGKVQVKTPERTLTSNVSFRVA
jgi:uncharacterized repeat protein (TIGR03803 family)